MSLPTLTVTDPAATLTLAALRPLEGEPLARFLQQRRWFGAKAGAPREARFHDVTVLPWEGGPFAITRVDVVTATGARLRYQLPLAVRAEEEPRDAATAPLATVRWGGGSALLIDAVDDPVFRRRLVDAFARGDEVERDGVRWVIEQVGSRALVVPPGAPITVGSAEQSNTSILVDQEAILKLFRRLETGPHPELELTRFLSVDAGFAHVPALLGAIRVDDAGGSATAGILQEFLPKSSDAWSWTLERAAEYFAAPRDAEPRNRYVEHAEHLGRVTREMHEALASDETREAFAPVETEPEDVERWAHGAQRWVNEATALLERQLAAGAVPAERRQEAGIVVRRRDHYVHSVDEIVDQIDEDAGLRIRTHGDYHLGQVLRTASDDFVIIDFEGEPARPLEERREKTSPLRDVAGMLRSFAYAAATLGLRGEGGSGDLATRELRMARWERDARAAFLAGYTAAGGDDAEEPGILPEDPANVRRVVALFETEKVFYELAYELNNRPDWVGIPLRGISKLLV